MLIGGVACRYEKSPCGTVLYVATLGVLAPYRGRGVGQRLLLRALAEAQKDPAVGEAYCHVQARAQGAAAAGGGRAAACMRAHPSPPSAQACNSEAVAFYAKFGFAVKETLVGYYRRLPAGEQDALVLSRSLRGWAPPPGLLAIPGDDDTELTLDAP